MCKCNVAVILVLGLILSSSCGEGSESSECPAGASCGVTVVPPSTTQPATGAGQGGAGTMSSGGSTLGSGGGTVGPVPTMPAPGTGGSSGMTGGAPNGSGSGAVAGAGTGGSSAAGAAGSGASGMAGSNMPAATEPMLPLGNPPVPSAGCGKADSPGSGRNFSIDVSGMERTYIVAVPSNYDANKPHKLFFAWHYLGGSASIVASSGYYGLQSRAGDSGIFVSAEGLNAGWGSPSDIPFARAMLAWMKANYCVDESRVFSTGFSYGAIMSNRVGCEMGDQFRAIAPMSGGSAGGGFGRTCVGQVAAWISHGTSDAVLPFSGGEGARDYWSMANHCSMETMAGTNRCVNFTGCDEGYPVVWCELSGGHVQPSFGSSAIFEFFSQF
jgi:polyhydroxybutyrate depolymerase